MNFVQGNKYLSGYVLPQAMALDLEKLEYHRNILPTCLCTHRLEGIAAQHVLISPLIGCISPYPTPKRQQVPSRSFSFSANSLSDCNYIWTNSVQHSSKPHVLS